MPSITKLFDYTTTDTDQWLGRKWEMYQTLMVPYVQDGLLYALMGIPWRVGFVNLTDGTRTMAKDAAWISNMQAEGGAYPPPWASLVEPFNVKDSKLIMRWVYYDVQSPPHIRIRKETYDLVNKTISGENESLDITFVDPDGLNEFSWVLGGKTYITASNLTGYINIIRFFDLVTGSVVTLDLTSWLGTSYRSLIMPKVVSKGKELEMVVTRYIAGDVHRWVNINTGTGTNLVSTGGGSPKGSACCPLHVSDKRLNPLTSSGVNNSVNRIDWYNETWAKVGETSFSEVTYPQPSCGTVIGKLANGNFLMLLHITNQTGSWPASTYMKLYELNASTFAVVNSWLLDTISTVGASITGWGSWGWGVLQTPIVDVANKLIYVLCCNMTNTAKDTAQHILYKINISDFSIDEWNTFLWLIKTASPKRVEKPKFFDDLMQTHLNLDELEGIINGVKRGH